MSKPINVEAQRVNKILNETSGNLLNQNTYSFLCSQVENLGTTKLRILRRSLQKRGRRTQ